MDDNSLKLEFSVEEPDGLDFEQAPPPKNEPKPEPKPEIKTEFLIPNIEDIPVEKPAPKKPEPTPDVVTPLIERTYVPRFTDASPYPSDNAKKPKDDNAKKPPVAENAPDPTAEIDENAQIPGATVVTFGAPAPEPTPDTTRVFKFNVDDDDDEAPAPEAPEKPKVDEPKVDEPKVDETDREDLPVPQNDEEYVLPAPNPLAVSDRRALAPSTVEVKEELPASIGKNGKREYTDPASRETVKDKFLDTILSVKVRLVASLVIAALVLVVENIWMFGVELSGIFGSVSFTGTMALIDMQLVICLAILASPEILLAFRRLARGRAVPELFIPISLTVLVAYYVVVMVNVVDTYYLLGAFFAILTINSIIATLHKTQADFANFKTVSSQNDKLIVDKKLTRSLGEENIAVDGKVEGYKSKTARFFRATFITDFFETGAKCSENSGNTLASLAAVFGIAFVAGAVAFFIPGGFTAALTAFASVFAFGLPSFSLLSHKLPFLRSVKHAEKDGAAIIGESALYEHSDVDVVAFDDVEVFGEEDVSLQRIMLYGKSENLEKAMHQMSSVFSVLGGPLKNMFSDSLDHTAPRAEKVLISEDGVLGIVDGNEVRAGSLEYMVQNGITIPYEPAAESATFSTKIMYAAENGEVYAKFYIRYTFSEEFTMLLPSLEDELVTPLVYTRDPNINNELLRTLAAGADKVRVLKKLTLPATDDAPYSRASASIVATEAKESAINAILLSKRYVRMQSKIELLELISAAVGSAIALAIAFSGISALPTAILALWHVGWGVALSEMSRRALAPTVEK